MKIIVSRQELQAALLFASSDESRFVLNSVCIEVNPRHAKPTIIATDGRRLAVIQSQAEQEDDFDQKFQLLLKSDFVKPICALSKALGGKVFPWIAITAEPLSKEIGVEIFGAKCFLDVKENALVEGQYPDWRQCVPNKKAIRTQINDLGVNAEFVADFAKAAKLFDVSPVVQINLIAKESAIEVKLSSAGYFYGLVMPCEADERVDYQPEFLGITKDLPIATPKATETQPGMKEAA